MSSDNNNKAESLFSNPLPIVMVVLLTAGVLIKTVPLESMRPTDPERMKSVSAKLQNIEARLWQDPFAAIEQHVKDSNQAATPLEKRLMGLLALPEPHFEEDTISANANTMERLNKDIQTRHNAEHNVTVVAVSVFGSLFYEEVERRRRTRVAVVAALNRQEYYPVNENTLGYFNTPLTEPETQSQPVKLTVPFEWFKNPNGSAHVLVLWLNEDKLSVTKPFDQMRILFNKLAKWSPEDYSSTQTQLKFKLIGPAGSEMMVSLVRVSLVREMKNKPLVLERGTLEVFSPNATISQNNLEALGEVTPSGDSSGKLDLKKSGIIRATGTDDMLATALLWELWQRGVNRELGYVDPWWQRKWASFVRKSQDNPSLPHRKCEDGLVLIGEQDTEYGRRLLQHLNEEFLARCGAGPDGKYPSRDDKPPVHMFSYLRGLDGVLPRTDGSASKMPPRDDSSKSKDIRAQFNDAPPEHAEGRNQFDYVRRLGDEIDRLDRNKDGFAEKGVKAIGIVGSDVYDKLTILQALRNRFKDKIFFTTDLDARYLHADQKGWTRNLVIASNFGLSLHPTIQRSALPFRDSYQTATYLATMMALENKQLDHWNDEKKWFPPQIFEIGRTEAVHLASPSVEHLEKWKKESYNLVESNEDVILKNRQPCNTSWTKCKSIEPHWLLLEQDRLPLKRLLITFFIICLGFVLLTMSNRNVYKMVCRTYNALISPRWRRKNVAQSGVINVALLFAVFVAVFVAVIAYYFAWEEPGTLVPPDEPLLWLEGISVWPNLVLHFFGLITLTILTFTFFFLAQHQARLISKDFKFGLPRTRTKRSFRSAVLDGPHYDLTLSDNKGKAVVKPPSEIKTSTLWQKYLHVTSFYQMMPWIVVSLVIVAVCALTELYLFGWPQFPARGQFVVRLNYILLFLTTLSLWLTIFWVSYETRACTHFIKTLSEIRSMWPTVALAREEVSTGVPREYLNDYLYFQLIGRITQRIRWLIYLPFISLLFIVFAQSNFFDAMNFSPVTIFATWLALIYTLGNVWLLRKSAEAARTKALECYKLQLLKQTGVPQPGPAQPSISVGQINILMERIRNAREGALASLSQQPMLQALLLPFGGYGGMQLIEYLLLNS